MNEMQWKSMGDRLTLCSKEGAARMHSGVMKLAIDFHAARGIAP